MITEENAFFMVATIFIVGILVGLSLEGTVIMYPTNTFSEKTIILAAVNNDGGGVAIPLNVEVKHGDGKVLTNIDKLLFWADTQQSIQIARDVAENITGINTNDFDLIYSLDSDEMGIVGGPSAGASLTIATIAALTNQTINENIIMSGTINQDGTIGEVGGLLEKAKAAKDIGAEIFLVPKGQSIEIRLTPEEVCEKKLGFVFCQTKYNKEQINIGENSGIDVIEVKDIHEAINFFLD